MNSRLAVAVLSVCFVGCEFNAKQCAVNSDCPSGAVCGPNGFCMAGDGGAVTGGGGGTTGGGGGVTGGGGGSTGGGTGGGATGGGGGGVDPCMGVTCPAAYECRGAGVCELGFDMLTLSGPTLTNSRGIALTATLSRKAGFSQAVAPSTVTVESTLPGGGSATLSGAGTYSGTLMVTQDGTFPVHAKATFARDGGVDELMSGDVTVTVDTLAPTVNWQNPVMSAKRDDKVVLRVSASEALNPATVTASLGVDGGMVPLVAETATCTSDAGCFTADFSLPEMKAVTQRFDLVLNAKDLAGNAAPEAKTSVDVTRIRWTTTVAGGDLRAAPAVGPDGRVYVGTSNGAATSGRLVALNWADGSGADAGVSAGIGPGGIVSVAVSPSTTSVGAGNAPVVFAAYNPMSGAGELRGFSADFSGGLPPAAAGLANNKVWSGVGLGRSGAQVFAVATTASSSNLTTTNNAARVLKWDSIAGAVGPLDLPQISVSGLGYSGSPLEPLVVGGTVQTAVGVVIRQTTARFVTSQPNSLAAMPSAGLFVREFAVGSQPGLDAGVQIETSDSAYAAGQAMSGGKSVVGTLTAGARRVHVVDGLVTTGTPFGSVDYGVPAIAEGGYGIIGAGNAIVRFDPSSLSTGGTSVAPLGADSVKTSPVLGKAVGGRNATGYAVTGTGKLVVFDASATGTASSAWTDSVAPATSVVTHPAFDCNRRAGAARSTTGILYVPFLDGTVVAVIVDSPALMDANGAWPKYQRTSGNAGNDDTAFFPTNWSCP